MKKQIVDLIVGDWSSDGHGRTEKISIKSNLNKSQIQDAYKKGVEISGVNLEQVCCEYEGTKVPREIYEKLTTAGMYNDDVFENEIDEDGDGDLYINAQDFAFIYLFLVELGNPTFRYKIIQPEKINIGGYGLLS